MVDFVTSLWGKLNSQVALLRVVFVALAMALPLIVSSDGYAQPTATQSFSVPAIGSGNVSVLRIDLQNLGAIAQAVQFGHTIPNQLEIATPANLSTDCQDAVVSAPEGGTSITFSGGRMGTGSTCSVVVSVTGSTAQVQPYLLSSFTLGSSQGNSVSGTTQLTVDPNLISFTASFSQSTVEWGDVTTLQYSFQSPTTQQFLTSLLFTDTFDGFVVADPSNFASDCQSGNNTTLVEPGSNEVSIDFGFYFNVTQPGCTVSFDVLATDVGRIEHLTPNYSTADNFGTTTVVGASSAALQVTRAGDLHIRSEFIDDPVIPGSLATMRFTINNFDRGLNVVDVAFSENLDLGLSGLVASGLPLNNVCGVGSVLQGTNTISLSGASIAPESECEFDLEVIVPIAASLGTYTLISGAITGTYDGVAVSENQSTAKLHVQTPPLLTQNFIPNSIESGGATTLEITIQNTNLNASITEIGFTHRIEGIHGALQTQPANASCGAGSVFSLDFDFDGGQSLKLVGGGLAPGQSCTFQIPISIPPDTGNGIYLNTVSGFAAISEASLISGELEPASLEVIAAPTLHKSFTPSSVTPGATLTLQYHLRHDKNAASAASDISFNDDIGALLTGLVATNLPLVDVCGTGSQFTGTSDLSLSGGTLTPGESCVFEVTLQVPSDAPSGDYSSISGPVNATLDGNAVVGQVATDDFHVTNLLFGMEFVDDPVRPGQAVELQYSIENIGALPVSDIFFTTPFSSGLIYTGGTLTDVCGVGSQLAGTSTIFVSGGVLGAGESCTISISLNIPINMAPDSYPIATSVLSASVEGGPVSIPPANDFLLVANPLLLSKAFEVDNASIGQVVRLTFTLANADAVDAATALSFTDDLNQAFSGMVALGLPLTDVCGVGSTITGTNLLSFSGGSLSPGATCSFDVMVQLPTQLGSDTQVNNVTSELSGLISGLVVNSGSAIANLDVSSLSLALAIAPETTPGDMATLSFTLQNHGDIAVDSIRLSDNLESTLVGLTSSTLPADGFCGPNSTIVGGSAITISGVSLAGQASCSFDVEVSIPSNAVPGDYLNSSSVISTEGVQVGAAASDTLTVLPFLPAITGAFDPSTVVPDAESVLTINIDNAVNQVALTGISFTTTLPAGLSLGGDATTTCSGGAITTDSQSGTVELTNGSADANGSCTVIIIVSGAQTGDYPVNIGIDSKAGPSPQFMTSLKILELPSVSIAFTPSEIVIGETSVLSIVVDNPSAVAAETLAFTSSLPIGLRIESSDTTCSGMFVAATGSRDFSLSGGTLAAASQCTITLTILADEKGSYVTQIELMSPVGSSGNESAALEVAGSSQGGCCSTGNRSNKFPVEMFLVIGFWLLSVRRRRNRV